MNIVGQQDALFWLGWKDFIVFILWMEAIQLTNFSYL